MVAEGLQEKQRHEMRSLIEEIRDVFTDVPGNTDLAKHRIELTSEYPVRSKPYAVPFNIRLSRGAGQETRRKQSHLHRLPKA